MPKKRDKNNSDVTCSSGDDLGLNRVDRLPAKGLDAGAREGPCHPLPGKGLSREGRLERDRDMGRDLVESVVA